mgnify:CR=1 FL=1
MADVIMGKTETEATAIDVISNVVQSFLIQESKLLGTVTDYSSLAVKGAKSITLPKSGGFLVNDKVENVAVSAQSISYSGDVLNLNKHKVIQALVEDISDWQASIPVIQDALMKATKAIALQVDLDIIEALKLASAADPDHQIKYIDTVNNILALGDILAQRKLLVDQNIDPRTCFIGIGSLKEAEMLNISNFIDASKYGTNEAVMMGEIGKVFGMKVILHTAFENNMIAWHPSAVGYAIQQGMRYQNEKDLANLGVRHSLDMLYGVTTLDAGKRQVYTSET